METMELMELCQSWFRIFECSFIKSIISIIFTQALLSMGTTLLDYLQNMKFTVNYIDTLIGVLQKV